MGSRHDEIDDNIYGFISSGELHIKGIVRELRFDVKSESSDPSCLYYASPTTSRTGFLSETPETVLLDAPLESGLVSSQTFHCLLLGRQKKIRVSLTQVGDQQTVAGYLILEATGEPDQYRRVGWAEVIEHDYDSSLWQAEQRTVKII